ncbi:DUF2004 domain-containing protein [Agromyces archimandritae]|uniref:DUF2004 domain-containing protein n=1 Tax=Agromyces archimandritae TaxID=2781962 RepID=A0A975FLT3_9MICO|nr:DUF2004 domain-containing protein [Agromyces archimandritae]QTX04464.1 DUF2004 domain-containing protein [Agromyces archimandritae]
MSTEHDYFGLIGDYWSERVEFADQDVEVVLDADEDTVSTDALDAAAAMIGELEVLDADMREGFLSQLSETGSPVSRFLEAVLGGDEETRELAEAAVSRDSGDRQVDAIRSFSLVRVDFRPDADADGDAFAEFEYGLAPEDLEQRLVVTIDLKATVVDVRFDE